MGSSRRCVVEPGVRWTKPLVRFGETAPLRSIFEIETPVSVVPAVTSEYDNEMSTMHLSDWEVWQYASRKSEVTITERIRVIRHFHAETGRQPVQVDALEIVRWLAGHAEWSDSTLATYTSYLNAWFKWLQVQELRLDNPMIKVGSAKYPDRIPRPVDDSELVTLLVTRMHRRTRVMILLAALAGLRVHEIAKFRGEDLEHEGTMMRVTGKGRRTELIPLHPILIEVAQSMPARGWWFPSNSKCPGQHIRSKSVSDIIGRAMRRAGISGTPHSLRHWFGTTLLDDGADLRTVQMLMRHKSIQSTQGYTKVRDVRRIEAIGRLDVYRGTREIPEKLAS